MNISELLRWQYSGYEKFHRSRANLLIHIFAVPMVLISNVALIMGFFRHRWLSVAINLALIAIFVALQSLGHRREAHPPEPFTGAKNAMTRLFLEQWITFPRFVFSGGWWRGLRRSQDTPTAETKVRS